MILLKNEGKMKLYHQITFLSFALSVTYTKTTD